VTTDRFQRPLRDLRISVTDRCNFRCQYCMPRELFGADHAFLPRAQILSYEEIVRVATAFADLGVTKLRLTGGEPLLRRDLHRLVEGLAAIPGIDDIALTTNGVLLAAQAQALKIAGLHRVTVSLDALDNTLFQAMSDTRYNVTDVLAGVQAAQEAGFERIKVNAVIKRGVNETQILPLVEHFRHTGITMRFIEFMDVGETNGWCMGDVVSAQEILATIAAAYPIETVGPLHPGEVAKRWRLADGSAEVGVISSVTQPFCQGCTRARLSAEGKVFTCLFANHGLDLRPVLRDGSPASALSEILRKLWTQREDRYSELRSAGTELHPKAEMSYLGG